VLKLTIEVSAGYELYTGKKLPDNLLEEIMDKKEFLSILREALEGEVDSRVVEQNISFYNDYISSQANKSEEEVIEEIGDPRLIAKTIIETESSSGGQTGGGYYSYYSGSYNDSTDYDNRSSSQYNRVYHVKWYHMVLIALIALVLLTTLIRIGWFMIKFLFVFSVPIIFIFLLWILFRKR
jgi:uncharacterized membrane protein